MAMKMRRYFISFLSHRRQSSTATASATPSFVPPRNPLSLLKSSICAESNPDKIFALLQSSTHFPRFYDDRFLHTVSVDKLARAQRHDLVERLLETHKSDPAAPKSEGFYIRIMSLYNLASMPDHALRTFEQIPSHTEKSVCAFLSGYLKRRRFDRVRELFDSVATQHGIVPGVSMHNILLSALCEEGEVQNARKLLDEMLRVKKVRPNIVSYNTILSAYLKNEDEAGCDDILKEISRNEVGHNISTYNLRISNFCKRKESLEAEKLLEELISEGLHHNSTTFRTIIKGFCKEGDLNSAIRVFNRMKIEMKNGVSPARDIYVALLRAMVDKGDFTSALSICKEFIEKDFFPPHEVAKALVIGLVKDSKIEDARDLVATLRDVARSKIKANLDRSSDDMDKQQFLASGNIDDISCNNQN